MLSDRVIFIHYLYLGCSRCRSMYEVMQNGCHEFTAPYTTNMNVYELFIIDSTLIVMILRLHIHKGVSLIAVKLLNFCSHLVEIQFALFTSQSMTDDDDDAFIICQTM